MKLKLIYDYLKNNLFTFRIFKFSIIGSSGVVVNMGILYVLTEFFHLHYLISSLFAIELSIISNFILNTMWTWNDRKKKEIKRRLVQYHISTILTALIFNWLLLVILTELVGIYYLVSNLIGVAIGMISNFIINDLWTFKEKVS